MKKILLLIFAMGCIAAYTTATAQGFAFAFKKTDSIAASAARDTIDHTFTGIETGRQVDYDCTVCYTKAAGRDSSLFKLQHQQQGTTNWTTLHSQTLSSGTTTPNCTRYTGTYTGGKIREYVTGLDTSQHQWVGLFGSWKYK